MAKKAVNHGAPVEDFLERAASGDAEAQSEIFDRLAPRLVSVNARFGVEEADDGQALQELFFGLMKEARRLRQHEGSASAWITFAARTGRIEKRRASAGLPRAWAPRQNPLRVSLAWMPRAAEIDQIDERRELLNKVLRHLPKPQMKAMEMAVFEGLTENEIARRLEQPLGVVRAELRAAFRFLRHRLSAVLGIWSASI